MTLESSQKYNISQVAKWFHAFPHIDITFSHVNSTFDPSSNSYLEALGIIIAIPGFWLILTLLAFLIFFLCRCCDSSFKRKRKVTCLKFTLGIFAILCCGALAVGLYGNEETDIGVHEVSKSTRNMAKTFSSIRNQTVTIQMTLEDDMQQDINKLEKIFNDPLMNTTVHMLLENALVNLRNNTNTEISVINEIDLNITKVDLQTIPDTIDQVEIIRWPVTMAAIGLLIILCLILIWGLIRHSRCFLILFSVIGLLCVVICWALVSLYVGICVAVSDFCFDPEPFLHHQAKGLMGPSVLNYYLHCDPKTPSPFYKAIKDGNKAIESMQSSLGIITEITHHSYPKKEVRDIMEHLVHHINQTDKLFLSATALLDCQKMHDDYVNGMDGLCTHALEGIAFMLVSAVGAGLLLTILIWVASHTWIHIRKKPPPEHIDEEDPFLPSSAVTSNSRRSRDTYGSTGFRPRYSHTPPQTPHFTASLNGHSGSHEDHAFLQGRYSPPPAKK